LKKKVLKRCWEHNPNGAGFMFAVKGQIHLCKEVSDFGRFYQTYARAVSEHGHRSTFVLHFRLATSGVIDEANCHPHWITHGKLAYVHNGILPFTVPRDSPECDTVIFARSILARLPEGFLDNKPTTWLIEQYIGNSKLVFLASNGQTWILNEALGVWDDGVWYSNTTYRDLPRSSFMGRSRYWPGDKWKHWTPTGSALEADDELEGTPEDKESQGWVDCGLCGVACEANADAIYSRSDGCWVCDDCRNGYGYNAWDSRQRESEGKSA
jgi:hypothetical protein